MNIRYYSFGLVAILISCNDRNSGNTDNIITEKNHENSILKEGTSFAFVRGVPTRELFGSDFIEVFKNHRWIDENEEWSHNTTMFTIFKGGRDENIISMNFKEHGKWFDGKLNISSNGEYLFGTAKNISGKRIDFKILPIQVDGEALRFKLNVSGAEGVHKSIILKGKCNHDCKLGCVN